MLLVIVVSVIIIILFSCMVAEFLELLKADDKPYIKDIKAIKRYHVTVINVYAISIFILMYLWKLLVFN